MGHQGSDPVGYPTDPRERVVIRPAGVASDDRDEHSLNFETSDMYHLW